MQIDLTLTKIPIRLGGMVALLSIGTEITTGQILNRNAQWLSTELLSLGLNVNYQMSVPDSKDLIQKALDFLTPQSRIIVITGGLGPTSDDFTRNILAEIFNQPLEWNEPNWQKVQGKLQRKGVQVRPLHRQQCEFPQGALIYDNNQGIADGFRMTLADGVQIYALPGPPKELAALWESHLKEELGKLSPEPLQWTQKIWTVQGLPESEVASKIAEALGEDARHALYRIHSPNVDVKLYFQKKDSVFFTELGEKIEKALEKNLIKNT